MKVFGSVALGILTASSVTLAEDPPPACLGGGGGESFQVEIQGSRNASYYPWQSGTIYIETQPGLWSEVNIRTRMTIASGETRGWSFSLEPDSAQLQEFQSSGGYLSLGTVTTSGTDVETLNPSVNSTAARTSTGYTQGIVVDTSLQRSLPPSSDFVTSKACYSFMTPYSEGYWIVRLKFTHEVGSPAIRTVGTQGSQSNVPCARNLDLVFIVAGENSYSGACTIQGASGFSGPAAEGAGAIEAGGGTLLALTGADPCQPPTSIVGTFRRGDSNSDGDRDISDPISTLDFLFLGVYQPTCMEALDANDDSEVDQTTGFAGLAWYDAIEDPQNIRVKLYATHNSGRGTPFLAPFPVSSGASDGRTSNDVLGDYIGLAFHDTLFLTVWADNSDPVLNGEAEIFADRRVIPGE